MNVDQWNTIHTVLKHVRIAAPATVIFNITKKRQADIKQMLRKLEVNR
jgi:hypothetical protein